MKKLLLTLFIFHFSFLIFCKAQYTVWHNFGLPNDGGEPNGSLILSGNMLYGMANIGGLYYDGVIFEIDTNGNGYKKLLDFSGLNGKAPYGSLILSGSKLFGMTSAGGLYNDGTVFEIDTDGTGYKKLLDFNDTNGKEPMGDLTLSLSGTTLYGMAGGGGLAGDGVVFKIDTSGNEYKDLLNFVNGTSGAAPIGSLTLSGSKLFGMTYYGCVSNDGTVFALDTNGSGYKKLLNFSGTNGANPYGSLLLSGNDLFGMTNSGGASGQGIVFKIDTNGSRYKDMLDYTGANGAYPFGSLILSGDKLYGMTDAGGANSYGVVFELDTNNSNYRDLYDFTGTTGKSPYGSLTLFGGNFYGLTTQGGATNNGVVFKLDTTAILLSNTDVTLGPEGMKVFPNPNKGLFQIQANSYKLTANNSIEVYNTLGEKVYSARLNASTTQIDLSSNANGVYQFRVITETGSLVSAGKFIIQK